MDKVVEVVLVDEVLGDVGELDLRVLGIVEWSAEVVLLTQRFSTAFLFYFKVL